MAKMLILPPMLISPAFDEHGTTRHASPQSDVIDASVQASRSTDSHLASFVWRSHVVRAPQLLETKKTKKTKRQN